MDNKVIVDKGQLRIPSLDVAAKVPILVLEFGLSGSLHKDVRTHSPKPKSDFGNE